MLLAPSGAPASPGSRPPPHPQRSRIGKLTIGSRVRGASSGRGELVLWHSERSGVGPDGGGRRGGARLGPSGVRLGRSAARWAVSGPRGEGAEWDPETARMRRGAGGTARGQGAAVGLGALWRGRGWPPRGGRAGRGWGGSGTGLSGRSVGRSRRGAAGVVGHRPVDAARGRGGPGVGGARRGAVGAVRGRDRQGRGRGEGQLASERPLPARCA